MRVASEPSAQLGGRTLRRVVFTEEQIRSRVAELGRAVAAGYGPDDDLLLLGLLKGSFVFMADLVRSIERPLQVDFLIASSYGDAKVSSGEVRMLYDAYVPLAGRSVVLIEDIVDSGTTLNHLVPMLADRGPKSLEVCTLLYKPGAALDRAPRWVGFEAPGDFLVGYGLDCAEDLRHLPYIASL